MKAHLKLIFYEFDQIWKCSVINSFPHIPNSCIFMPYFMSYIDI